MYLSLITELLSQLNLTQYNARHVYAYLLLEHDTLNQFSRKQIAENILLAIDAINFEGTDVAEEVAQSFAI
jgi:hypothetical protein